MRKQQKQQRKKQQKQERRYRPTHIRPWRQHRKLSLQKVAELVGETGVVKTTHATLSRIERGKGPYSQGLLERLAEVLGTDPASLLSRDPKDPDGMWIIWEQARPDQRARIVAYSRGVLDEAQA